MNISHYCVKCRTPRPMTAAYQSEFANGTPVIKGMCYTCGTQMNKIGKMPDPQPTRLQRLINGLTFGAFGRA